MQKLQKSPLTLPVIKAILKDPFVKRAKKAEFTAGNLSIAEGRYTIDFEGKKVGTSAILTNILGNLALAYTPEDGNSKEAGEEIDVVLV